MNDLMRSVINEQHTTPFKTILSGVNYQLSTADWVGKPEPPIIMRTIG